MAREWRHDGRVVPGSSPVEAPTERVEIVLAPVQGARVRIVDAETRLTIYLAHCRCELVAGGETVGRSDFEPDRDGLAWVSFQDIYGVTDPPVVPESARLTVDKDGYEAEQVFELDARAPSGPEPGVTLLSTDEKDAGRGELTRVQPDGSFELQAHRGNHELFLIETTPGQWRSILARQPLVLDRDVEGLLLAPDPNAGVQR